jgi:hypothetical protein
MKTLSPSIVSRIAKSAVLCAGVLLASTSFMQAREVSVYLTSKRFGDKTGFVADSQTRTIGAATQYNYELKGKVRGQSGKPLEKIAPKGTDIATLVNLVSPGGSSFLEGTVANPGGTLPVTLMNKQFKGTKKVKFPGMKKSVTVKFDFTVVGSINADGVCVMEVKNVNISSKPKIDLGDIIFTKGAVLEVNDDA